MIKSMLIAMFVTMLSVVSFAKDPQPMTVDTQVFTYSESGTCSWQVQFTMSEEFDPTTDHLVLQYTDRFFISVSFMNLEMKRTGVYLASVRSGDMTFKVMYETATRVVTVRSKTPYDQSQGGLRDQTLEDYSQWHVAMTEDDGDLDDDNPTYLRTSLQKRAKEAGKLAIDIWLEDQVKRRRGNFNAYRAEIPVNVMAKGLRVRYKN